jgi:hypothetical protein
MEQMPKVLRNTLGEWRIKNMQIKDLVGLSKPLTRLIEVVSQGVGAVGTPYLIKRTADARAHEIKVIGDALKQVAEKNGLPVV